MEVATAPLAFIGTMELALIALVGLLLFGGELPKVLGELGRVWIKLRRSVNEFKRESGIDEAMREIKRETDFRVEEPRWRRDMDHAAGPAADAEPQVAELDAETPKADPAPKAKPAIESERPPDTGPSE
ncbi:MAG: hypothetical protein O3A20_01590 [Planctomycetota bacterium]|nr:hypothetical protein [Planctomycetota bacterium]